MTKIVDVRGLACPQPVILTKKAMAETGQEPLTAIVDNPTAEANVSRMARKAGWQVDVEAKDDGTYLGGACMTEGCHAQGTITTFNRTAYGDYDGDLVRDFVVVLEEW